MKILNPRRISSLSLSVTALIAASGIASAATITDENHHIIWSHQSTTGSATYDDQGGIALSYSGAGAFSASLASDADSGIGLTSGNSVKIAVTGISFSGNLAGYNEQLYFGLTSSPTDTFNKGGTSAIALYIDGSSVIRMGFKTASTTGDGWPHADQQLIPLQTLSGSITGFNLTLTETGYDLVVHTTSTSKPTYSFQGTYDLGEGWDDLGLRAQFRKGSSADGSGGITIGEITLQSIPEPSTAAFVGGGLLAGWLLSRRH